MNEVLLISSLFFFVPIFLESNCRLFTEFGTLYFYLCFYLLDESSLFCCVSIILCTKALCVQMDSVYKRTLCTNLPNYVGKVCTQSPFH